jgi:hypothetical protein
MSFSWSFSRTLEQTTAPRSISPLMETWALRNLRKDWLVEVEETHAVVVEFFASHRCAQWYVNISEQSHEYGM